MITAITRRLLLALALSLGIAGFAQAAGGDPLPSWRDTAVKQAIIDFVTAATKEGGPDFIPTLDRIATFDNDGTLWAEQPIVQLQFVLNDAAVMAKKNPKVAALPEVKALLKGDKAYFTGPNGEAALMKLLALTSSNMSPTTFADTVGKFFALAKHPTFGVPYKATTYQPMLELLAYLRANGFETWICSGGGIDFMRVVSEDFYGIPPQQVIGSSGVYDVKLANGKVAVVKAAKVDHVNDQGGKVTGLITYLGRPPVFAAGNERSGGDIAHLTYSQSSPYPSFQLMINHDDGEREFAYSEKDGASLAAAKAGGWHVVSMHDDWLTIFPGH